MRTVYRLLLKLYPARFREEYTTPLEQQFWDEYRELPTRGARAHFWLRELTALAVSIPREFAGELRQDLAYASRIYRRRSAATGLALVALALAIGAATGVFSVVNALLLRGLPFREPERLVEMKLFGLTQMTPAAFREWQHGAAFLESAAAYRTEEMNVATEHDSARLKVAETSAGFFATMGSEPTIGRAFTPEEEIPGQDDVAVISHGLWLQFLGGAPQALGSRIWVNGRAMTVVGIAPPAFEFPGGVTVWTPTAFDIGHVSRSRAIWYSHMGRLRPGFTLARANGMYWAEMARLGGLRPVDHPELIPLRDQLAGSVRQASLVLLGVVLFVLLTACANIAHLLLSRVSERRQELMLRAALGASRARLVQQLISESTLLTLVAAAAGLAVARWASRLAEATQPPSLSAQTYTILDWRVFGFAAGLALLTGLLFGVLPASLIGRMVRGSGDGVHRMRGALIAMQVAFTLVLVAGSITLGRAFLRLTATDLGFQADHVVTMSVALSGTPEEQHAETYYREVLARLRALPGVEAAGSVELLPLVPTGFAAFPFAVNGITLVGVPVEVTPGYFRAMGTPILRGRDFTTADEESQADRPVIVNDAFARPFEGDLVGRILKPPYKGSMRVVGVVRSMRYRGPADGAVSQVFWLPGKNPGWNRTFVARVRGDTEAYLAICRDTVRAVDPRVPVYNGATLETRLRDSLAKSRFYTTVILFFGIFAVLLAAVGIFGVASFSIAQRSPEIGVRLALGATPQRLRTMLLRQSLLPVGAGLVLGTAGAAAMGRLAEHLVATAEPIRIATCAAAGLLLGALAAVTVWSATRRIVRIDPMRVLRAE